MSTNVPQISRVLQLIYTSFSLFYMKHDVTKIQTEVLFCNKSAEQWTPSRISCNFQKTTRVNVGKIGWPIVQQYLGRGQG
jgi:hypothetical protein